MPIGVEVVAFPKRVDMAVTSSPSLAYFFSLAGIRFSLLCTLICKVRSESPRNKSQNGKYQRTGNRKYYMPVLHSYLVFFLLP